MISSFMKLFSEKEPSMISYHTFQVDEHKILAVKLNGKVFLTEKTMIKCSTL